MPGMRRTAAHHGLQIIAGEHGQAAEGLQRVRIPVYHL